MLNCIFYGDKILISREKEIWLPYADDIGLEGTIFGIEKIIYDNENLLITAVLEPTEMRFQLKFPVNKLISHLVSFSDRVCHVDFNVNPNGGIYIVENSKYLEFESTDWIGQYPVAKHFALPSADITLEVLSNENPEILI